MSHVSTFYVNCHHHTNSYDNLGGYMQNPLTPLYVIIVSYLVQYIVFNFCYIIYSPILPFLMCCISI